MLSPKFTSLKRFLRSPICTCEFTTPSSNNSLYAFSKSASLNLVFLKLPSGEEIPYNNQNDNNFIKGSAVEFCQVVTQVRNIDDTSLNVFGNAATTWMEYAQCFAGQPEDPPQKGTRYIQKK